MNIKLENNENIEVFLLIYILGVLESLINNVSNIENSEKHLYNPYTVFRLKEKKVDNRIIELIELGCELEDVESLLPNKLNLEIELQKQKCLELLKEKSQYHNFEKWEIL